MNAAMEKARNSLDSFIAELATRKPTALYSVKARLKTDSGGVEHIWLDNVSYSGGSFTGIINDEPLEIKGTHKGDTVKVSRDEVSDWLIGENGQMRGAFTEEVVQRRMREKK